MLAYFFFIVIYIILFENGVLALYNDYTCKNVTESCYHLNELLSPCFYKIDFNEVFILESAGLDILPFPRCLCNKDAYTSLVSCSISCEVPFDNSTKFESDCRNKNFTVDIDEGKAPNIPTPTNLPDSPTPSLNTSKNTKSNLNFGMITGLIISVIIVIGAIIVIIKYKKDKRHPPPPPPPTPKPPTTQNSTQGQEFIADNSQQSFENRRYPTNPGATSDEL
ncbi:hypothetical protein C1645_735063 [Glomus cerebriforme]|uniref:Transmembrane protein n=1 Tax=Glomus cerebriforme TaxID=658196 RepID=A0A397TAR9_9GLOM|nr:hypothetical protein C1645_735063 [Glomus cerebriforme]